MKTLNTLYHIARADFLERTRRHSFLIMVGMVLFLGYMVNTGQISLQLDTFRGVYNSAWVGSLMTLVVNFFLGWFGFYLVKNAVSRDYETRVGQIMAATPLSRPLYLLGKWLSNYAVLAVLVFILMLAAVAMQLIQREDATIQLGALLAPFIFVALPFMALVAALAVLFESIRWLRGGFGNLVYFFFFAMVLVTLGILFGESSPLVDWLGFATFKSSMAAALLPIHPEYNGNLSLGMVPAISDIQPFLWPGVDWNASIILPRLLTIVWAVGLTLLGALFFDRFDTTPASPRAKRAAQETAPDLTAQSAPTSQPRLTPLPAARPNFPLGRLFVAELRLLLKGLAWWWYAIALGLTAASLFLPDTVVREGLMPVCIVWPLLVWSKIGCREMVHHTEQLVFSAPHPVRNQLPAAWLAGLALSLLVGAGFGLRLLLAGEGLALLTLVCGLIFIPSLALAVGVWSGSSKTFEVLYALIWYLGILNKVPELDYIGLHHAPTIWPLYLALSIGLGLLALLGRQRRHSA